MHAKKLQQQNTMKTKVVQKKGHQPDILGRIEAF